MAKNYVYVFTQDINFKIKSVCLIIIEIINNVIEREMV